MIKNLTCSVDLPLEEQYRENWGWEDSFQRYELDTEFQDKDYFENMDPNDLIKLVRKMENFLRERGISDHFFNNYFLSIQAFNKLDEEENSNTKDDYSNDWY